MWGIDHIKYCPLNMMDPKHTQVNTYNQSNVQQYVEDLPNEGQHEVVRISNYKDFQMIDQARTEKAAARKSKQAM